MHYFSRGKILFAGEYVVLHGATALAVPCRLGQHLEVSQSEPAGRLNITSRLNDHTWYEGTYEIPGFEPLASTDERVSAFVLKVFRAANELNPGFFTRERGYTLVSTLEFDTRWGLGSSSSLISNLAWWLDVDPYELFWKVSPGSGYDIACARSSVPLLYQLKQNRPVAREVDFSPAFKDNLYFVYLGKKQDSQYSVLDFRKRMKPDAKVIREISELSLAMLHSSTLDEFSRTLERHEQVMASFLGMPAVKQHRFPGFRGAMKSLGAWGGDLVLVTWEGDEEDMRAYFDVHGLKLIFRFDDLI